MTKHVATTDGFILGRFYRAGEPVELTPAQAEWELRAGRVRMAEDQPPAKKAGGKKKEASG